MSAACPSCGHVPPASRSPLSKRQTEVYAYLVDYISEHGYSPSTDEIRAQFGLLSGATVSDHVTALERKGYLKRTPGARRGIVLVDVPLGFVRSGVALAEHVLAFSGDHGRDAQPARLAGGPL